MSITLKDYGNDFRGKPIGAMQQSDYIDTLILTANTHVAYSIPSGETYRFAIIKPSGEVWAKVGGIAFMPSGESVLDGSSAERIAETTKFYIEDESTIGFIAPGDSKANILLFD